MTEERINTEPDDDDVNEEAESISSLKNMVQSLNELPTDVLKQLVENLDELEEYNATHPDED